MADAISIVTFFDDQSQAELLLDMVAFLRVILAFVSV